MRKHCNNPWCFKEKKLRSKIFNQLNMKKNKIDKDHFGKKKKRKNSLKKEKKHVGKYYSNP